MIILRYLWLMFMLTLPLQFGLIGGIIVIIIEKLKNPQ